jgi:predicted RNase H-like HicB family nuclease
VAVNELQGIEGDVMRYTVILERGRESGFVALCPALPGCVSQGSTKSQALENIREAAEVYIEALMEDGLPVPVEEGLETIEIEVKAS